MPCSPCKARKLLKQGKAKVKRTEPFTIQLLYGSSGYTQDITLGIDAGSKHIGVSATTKKKELYAADVEIRNDIVDKLSTRRQYRRSRRNRKTRYRKPKFQNRIKSKHKGWVAPSIESKINSHFRVVKEVYTILPVNKIIVETASFDIQKIQNPDINGTEYQQGDQLGFENVREYILWRDGHTCQCCKGKSKDNILEVHHIESRKTGGNSPNNLVTLCRTCHKGHHKGIIKLPSKIKRGMSFRDAVFMGIMRWTFYSRLKELYYNVQMTYGYITKHNRIESHLPKEHYIDAYCIAGNFNAERLDYYYYQKCVRKTNRQIHKAKIFKGGKKKLNQAPKYVKGFRLFDKVKYNGKLYYIFGRRSSGYFDVRTLSGEKINNGSISYKKLSLVETSRNILTERRNRFSLTTKVTSLQMA
jgi:hypothetical protein